MKPWVNALRRSPSSLTTRPASTRTSRLQASGQSSGQAVVCTVGMGGVYGRSTPRRPPVPAVSGRALAALSRGRGGWSVLALEREQLELAPAHHLGGGA